MLSFIPDSALHGQKPNMIWTRKHDADLLFGCYDHGMGNYDKYFADRNLIFNSDDRSEYAFKRVSDRIKFVMNAVRRYSDDLRCIDFDSKILSLNSGGPPPDFQRKVKEIFKGDKFKKVLMTLINFGVPVLDYEEHRDDFEFLRVFVQYVVDEPDVVP